MLRSGIANTLLTDRVLVNKFGVRCLVSASIGDPDCLLNFSLHIRFSLWKYTASRCRLFQISSSTYPRTLHLRYHSVGV